MLRFVVTALSMAVLVIAMFFFVVNHYKKTTKVDQHMAQVAMYVDLCDTSTPQ